MKVVINKCWGGFGLSALATKELAKRKGRKCYFFKDKRDGKGNLIFNDMVPITLEEATKERFMWYAYDCPNPHNSKKKWEDMTDKEKKADSEWSSEHSLYDLCSNIERNDPDLVAVVEKLEDKAYGTHAKLKVVEIPDNVEFDIHEYDGVESWG